MLAISRGAPPPKTSPPLSFERDIARVPEIEPTGSNSLNGSTMNRGAGSARAVAPGRTIGGGDESARGRRALHHLLGGPSGRHGCGSGRLWKSGPRRRAEPFGAKCRTTVVWVSRRRHQDKDIEKVLVEAENHGWDVIPTDKYWKLLCGCGQHKKWVKLTPSGAKYVQNLAQWFKRQSCW
jgi:hypothetical protein